MTGDVTNGWTIGEALTDLNIQFLAGLAQQWRKDRGLTMDEAAAAAGISQYCWNAIELNLFAARPLHLRTAALVVNVVLHISPQCRKGDPSYGEEKKRILKRGRTWHPNGGRTRNERKIHPTIRAATPWR